VSKLCFFAAAWLVAPDLFKVPRLRTPLSLVSSFYAVAIVAGAIDLWMPDNNKLFITDSYADVPHRRDRDKKYDALEAKRRELPPPGALLNPGNELAQKARIRSAASASALLLCWLLAWGIQWRMATWLDHDPPSSAAQNQDSNGKPRHDKLVLAGAWIFALGGLLDCMVWFSKFE
jgi:hypothetical protein